MILLGNILAGLAYVLQSIIWFAIILIFARVIISWVSADPYNPIVRFIRASTDPMMKPIQKYVPLVGGGLDLSPIVLLLLLYFLEFALVGSLNHYAIELNPRLGMGVRL